MSGLAYDANGEPFELPQSMAGWRVRKLNSKGVPEVVYGRDGLPLYLPLDADIEDLRREAREVGRYRLDPVDDRKRPILNAEAAYVCVPSADRTPDPAAASQTAGVQVEMLSRLVAALLESQKQHAELVRMYVSQFPVIVDALCSVIRAAGHAGLPQRATLMVPVTPDATRPEDQHGSDIDEQKDQRGEAPMVAAEQKHSWPKVLQSLLNHVGPNVGQPVSGLSGFGGDARVDKPAVQSSEPQPVRGTEDLAARRADLAPLVRLDAIARAKDAAHGAAPGSTPLHVHSSGADTQSSEPRAQDRGPTASPDADHTPGKRRDGWPLRPVAEPNGEAVAYVCARPDMLGPDMARPPVEVRAVDVGVEFAPAAVRDGVTARSPAGRDQRAGPTPTSPATDGDVGTARQTHAAPPPTVGEIAQRIADGRPSTDAGPSDATTSRDLSGVEPPGALPCIATAPPLTVLPGTGPPVHQDAAAASVPDLRSSRARSERDAEEKEPSAASAIRNGEASAGATPQPSVAMPASDSSRPAGSTGQYEVWPQATQTRDILQAFIAVFRSLFADRTPVYLSPPMETVSVPRYQGN
jgi:hypothetical protein